MKCCNLPFVALTLTQRASSTSTSVSDFLLGVGVCQLVSVSCS